MDKTLKKEITGVISTYMKEKKLIPSYEDLSKAYPDTFADMDDEFRTETNEILQEKFLNFFETGTTKSKEVLKRAFKAHPDLFLRFHKLNETRENLSKPEFHEVGKEVQTIIREGFELFINNQESSKYADFSFKTQDDFDKLVKQAFPLYANIGVVVRFVDPKTYGKK